MIPIQPGYPGGPYIPIQPIEPVVPPKPTFPLGRVTLKVGDTERYLARCRNCGPGAYSDSASVEQKQATQPYTIWTAEKCGNAIALKSDSGLYLSNCNNCWKAWWFKQPAHSDSAFVHVKNPSGNKHAQWIPERLENGKWALKNLGNGKYLSRCHDCVPGCSTDNMAFVHHSSSKNAFSQWEVESC